VRLLRQDHDLAKGMGEKLGAGAVLLRSLPAGRGARTPCEGAIMSAKASIKKSTAVVKSLSPGPSKVRNVVLVLGDQLNHDSAAFDGFDAEQDRVLMMETQSESTHVWSHKARITLFLSAMRHFAAELQAKGISVDYWALDTHEFGSLDEVLSAVIARDKPQAVLMAMAGDYRVHQALQRCCEAHGCLLQERADRHFYFNVEQFQAFAEGRKELRLEHFYRFARRQHNVLMEGKGAKAKPTGDAWNFDKENRGSFSAQGPGMVPKPIGFAADDITQTVMKLVNERFSKHPGSLAHFDWPVTRQQALAAMDDFIEHRLCAFGEYQDAMWQDQPYLYHSRLAAALNTKLINPKEVCDAAEQRYRAGRAPLAAVEGFIRQILGWREFVRGLYWLRMPDYVEDNALQAHQDLPAFYWTADTDMACMRDALKQTLDYGYAHHIQRLMVTGLFALLYGVVPKQVHEWYLAVYVDAVEWVELPNTIGMSQYADDGFMASKPYCASGKYIQRMSNYCSNCRYKPELSTGASACPFTTLYWDFLLKHVDKFANHPRAALQWRSLQHLSGEQRQAIQQQATQLRASIASTR
jgi:deoxyribodipyrimidine photolyase-related protein